MSWKYVGTCAIGSAHEGRGFVCQDNCFVSTLEAPSGKELLLAVAADGAGSAEYGHLGAEIACDVVKEQLEEYLGDEVAISEDHVHVILAKIKDQIETAAQLKESSPREYACTLVVAFLDEGESLFFQIGDGAIIMREQDELSIVFWPNSEEYANLTHFVTDANATDFLQVKWFDHPTEEVAIITDGLQLLALDYKLKSPHGPFFEPMFRTLRNATKEDYERIDMELREFLVSPKVNERTDDDKTLIIATRHI